MFCFLVVSFDSFEFDMFFYGEMFEVCMGWIGFVIGME